MRLLKRMLALGLCVVMALCLGGCRSVTLPDGETFIITKETDRRQSVEDQAQVDQRATQLDLPIKDDGAHYFVAQQAQDVQQLFWLLYRSIENFETRVQLPEGTTREQINLVDTLLYNDCPELFQMSHLSTYFYMQNEPDVITEVEVAYEMTRAEHEQAATQIEAIVSDWMQQTLGMTEYQKELFVHDAIINGCEYDNQSEHTGSIYGTLVLGRARCQGYANTMNYVLRRMGMQSLYVYGQATSETGTESHAWNVIRVNGVWSLVDVTWDDPKGGSPVLSHAYFNLNDDMMNISHVQDPDPLLDCVPVCDSLTWNYSVQQGDFFAEGEDATEAALQRLKDALSAGQASLTMQFATSQQYRAVADNLQSILQKAADQTGVYPTGTSYTADAKAYYLDILSITYN